MISRCPREMQRQRGVTLAVMLWFLAALALLAAGISYQARVDIKLAQLQRERAESIAAADGAIQMALLERQLAQQQMLEDQPRNFTATYRLGSHNVEVMATPLDGLISVNVAPPELLALLFAGVGGMAPEAANLLAQSVVEWRTPRTYNPGAIQANTGVVWPSGYQPRYGRLRILEDLLLIPGMNRAVMDRIRDAVYVAPQEATGVNWSTAPASVLQAIVGGDAALAQQIVQSRGEQGADLGLPPADLSGEFLLATSSTLYRMDAVVRVGGKKYLRRRWADTSASGQDGLPWSFFRSEPVRVL